MIAITSFYGLGERLDPVPATVVGRLGHIDRWSGQADLYRQQLPKLLEALRKRAQIESTEASSAIEGVSAPHARAEAIVADPSQKPQNRSEQELRGYSDALTYIFTEAVMEQAISRGLIFHLHRLLFAPTGDLGAGQIKTSDNVVVERQAAGLRTVRFRPVPASQADQALENLVGGYNDALERGIHHPLILTAAFDLDFTVIHPFADGNGRVSRLLIGLLLARSGYDVGKYVSIERLFESTEDAYYGGLLTSTEGWHENQHDPWPWIAYLIEIIESAYQRFVSYAEAERTHGTKAARVRRYIEEHAEGQIDMASMRIALPGISDRTLQKVVHEMRDAGLIQATSSGRLAQWRWIAAPNK